jgi:DNA (cytosine-5)-methyltransferase 1
MNYLSLFSGIGGLDLGLDRVGMTCVGQVEIDPFCRRVLAKHWPEVPRHDDVRTAPAWWLGTARPAVHLVAGGFPCQPFSTAGRRRGVADERWGWPWFWDVVRVARPRYVLVENVAALLRDTDAWGWILADLAEGGYDADWDCIPAAAVGAPHRRDRLFLVAHADSGGLPRIPQRDSATQAGIAIQAGRDAFRLRAHVADADGSAGAAARRASSAVFGSAALERLGRCRSSLGQQWAAEPDVGRVAYGVPARVDRLRGLGNAVVPDIGRLVGELIREHAEPRAEHQARLAEETS